MLDMKNQMLRIGANFPKISLTDIENKNITIPDDINTNFCVKPLIGVDFKKTQTLGVRVHSSYILVLR